MRIDDKAIAQSERLMAAQRFLRMAAQRLVIAGGGSPELRAALEAYSAELAALAAVSRE